MSIQFGVGISQESAHAFLANMEKSGAGASVGGAAIATELQARGIAEYGQAILSNLGVTTEVSVSLRTPTPTDGYSPNEMPYNVELFSLPTSDGKPLSYDRMIDEYVDRDELKERYRQILQKDAIIVDIAHFYVEAAVRGAVLEELADEFPDAKNRIIQVTHFHSSPDLMIRADNPNHHANHRATWERRMYEIAALHTSIVQFSTKQEQEMTAHAYDGVQGLTYEHI